MLRLCGNKPDRECKFGIDLHLELLAVLGGQDDLRPLALHGHGLGGHIPDHGRGVVLTDHIIFNLCILIGCCGKNQLFKFILIKQSLFDFCIYLFLKLA